MRGTRGQAAGRRSDNPAEPPTGEDELAEFGPRRAVNAVRQCVQVQVAFTQYRGTVGVGATGGGGQEPVSSTSAASGQAPAPSQQHGKEGASAHGKMRRLEHVVWGSAGPATDNSHGDGSSATPNSSSRSSTPSSGQLQGNSSSSSSAREDGGPDDKASQGRLRQKRELTPHELALLQARPDIPFDAYGNPTSIGSIGHGTHRCKPCVFVAKDLCQKGLECEFCHFPHTRRRAARGRRIRPSSRLQNGPPGQDGQARSSTDGRAGRPHHTNRQR